MIYVYGFCDGNSVHYVAEYQKRVPNSSTHGISDAPALKRLFIRTLWGWIIKYCNVLNGI